MRIRSVVLFPALLAVAIPYLQAQTTSNDTQENASVLKTTTRAVVVDVVVTGSNGTSIGGLDPHSFSVLEDGKLQAIDFFEEHTATSGPAITLPPLPPHVYSNEPATAPNEAVNVLLLDSLNTEEADQAYAHKEILGFLGRLQPGMRVAVYTLNTRLTLLQGFTADAALLRAAVDSKAAAPATTIVSRSRDDELADMDGISAAGSPLAAQAEARSLREYANDQDGQSASMTLTALQQLARSLEANPGRKNLIWFASKFPVALFPEGDNRKVLTAFHGHELPEALHETVDMLTRARVALYPVSARGLMDDRTTNADNGDAGMAWNPYQESPAIRATTAMMDQLATNTGGRAIYTTNDVSTALTRDIQDGSHYYTVAYTPSNEKMDGTFRRIEVKLAEGKYQLAYRRGYYADAGSAPAKPASDPLAPLLAAGMPDATQIVYRLGVTPESQPASASARAGGNAKLQGPLRRYRVLFQIPRDSMSFLSMPSGTHDAKIRVAVVAYGRDSKPVNWAGGEMALSLNEAQYTKAKQTGIAAPMEIDLPEAELSLSTGIWDIGAQRAGTLQVPVNPKTDAPADVASH